MAATPVFASFFLRSTRPAPIVYPCGMIEGRSTRAEPARHVALAFASGMAVLLAASDAAGQPPGEQVRFAWVRGEGADACIDKPALEQRVAERLGRDPFEDAGARSVEAVVTRDEGQWDVRVYVRDEAGALLGKRELTSAEPDCAAIEAAVTLALALVIDPEAALRPDPPPAPPAPPPPPPPPPAPPAPPAPPQEARCPPARCPPVPRATRPVPTTLTLGPLGAAGLLPRLAPGAVLSGGFDVAPWVAVTAGGFWLAETRTADEGFGFGLTAGWLGGCGKVLRGAGASLELCGKLFAGAIHAVTYVLEPVEPGARPWAALGAGPRLALRILPPLALELGLDAVAPLLRHQFRVQGSRELVFQQPAVAGTGFLGVGVSFP